MAREHLPPRRQSWNFSAPFKGDKLHISFSTFRDGRLGEVFVSGPKVGSDTRIAALEASVAASLALQAGIRADELLAALPVDAEGRPEGLLGVALQAWIQYAERVEEALT